MMMSTFVVVFLFALSALSAGDQKTFDCKMRQLALDYAIRIQPYRTKAQFQQVADALNGSPEAQGCNITIPNRKYAESRFSTFPAPAKSTVYVDAVRGSDTNTGTLENPYKTINKAVASIGTDSIILLRAGTHFLQETIVLNASHSGLTIQNYNGEEAWISGGVPLTPQWKPFNVSNSSNWITEMNENAIYGDHPTPGHIAINGTYDTWQECETMCQKNGTCNVWTWHDAKYDGYSHTCWFRYDHRYDPTPEKGINSGYKTLAPNIYIADLDIDSIPGLRVNTKRAIRARYPNADPEIGFGSRLAATEWLKPTVPSKPDSEYYPETPLRNTTPNMFQRYYLGIGGPCEHFTPPAGYWCGTRGAGGGPKTYTIPSGIVVNQTVLPHSPYKDPTTGIVQAWRVYHWASWMFEIGNHDVSVDGTTSTFVFSKGGFQGGRGNDRGDWFYIENIFEELDNPNEYFFDEKTKMLYYFHNGTGTVPSDWKFVATNLQTLFNVSGTRDKPVMGISFRGVGFRDAAYTYMEPHGIPSGGDWALQRYGALFFEGTEGAIVDSCVFERLDGNAVMISGYNRNATIQKSEFVWIGDSAIASWGYTTGSSVDGMGPDGTDGNQPRFNNILYNFVHELGIWEKQSSFYFQSKSCQNLLQGNIFFNGPRAGINFNDGFGGGSNLTENILFNTCRESGDHGPFNSWDRQVYVTKLIDGKTPSPVKLYDYISRNFMIANYNSQEAIDNDDGSCYYETFNNFFAYSGNGMKSDFDGHDNHHHDNVYAYVGEGYGINHDVLPGHQDHFYNNYVVMNGDGDYGHGTTCSGPGMTVVYGNRIFTPKGNVTECGMSLAAWQAKGNDKGTTAGKWPDDDDLIAAAKKALGMV